MKEEYMALEKNNKWHLVPPQQGKNLFDSKWVIRIKIKSYGTIDHYKVRLVAKGFKEKYGKIVRTPSVPLLRLPPFVLFCLLLFLWVGALGS